MRAASFVAAMSLAAACSSSGTPKANTHPSTTAKAKTDTSQSDTSSDTSTDSTDATDSNASDTSGGSAAACTMPRTSDPYDGFHIGVPDGWHLNTLNGMVIVSTDGTGSEETAVIPALLPAGQTPAAYFSSALDSVKKQVAGLGGTLTASVNNAGAKFPTASLTVQTPQGTLKGTASVAVFPQASAHGSSQAALFTSWAPEAKFDAERDTLAGIAACYGPEPGTLFQVIQDQAFTYSIPLQWKVQEEDQDTITIANSDNSFASYTLATAPQDAGVTSAQSLLTWAFGKLGITVNQVLSSSGGSSGQFVEELLATMRDGTPAHAYASVVSTSTSGGTTGGIRLGFAKRPLFNAVQGALLHIMSGIQHKFTQDLQQWEHLNQQSQNFNRNVEGFDDALNGVDLVHDPVTGQTFEAPYGAYSATGPDGPGYYDSAGNRLQIQTP